jgi:acetyl-CoA carboxylase biotin carboxyl carrier protein
VSLSEDDVREILRIIDASPLRELKVTTEGFSLHVLRDAPEGGASLVEPPPSAPAGAAVTIEAPMLGTFYRAEAPGEPAFVEVGASVEPDTIVCIIEVMKMMNSVPAGVAGTVLEVCAENAELVEYGAPLFLVEPRA